MSDVPLRELRQWVAALAPEVALTDPHDRRYVDLDQGGVRGARGARAQLERGIELLAPEAEGRFLLSGFPGTGKTTELHRLRQHLEVRDADPAAVVMIAADQWLDVYAPPTVTDLLRVLTWELDRAADRAEGKDPDAPPGYAERLWKWLQSDVELKSIGFGAFGASLGAEIRDNPSFRERVDRALQLRFQQFAAEAREVQVAAVARLRRATGRTRVVILVDGLEKFAAPSGGDAARAMEAAVESVYCTHHALLRLPAQVVLTYPVWLRFRRPDLGTLHGTQPLLLPMVKVHGADGADHAPGLERLTSLLTARLPDPRAFGDDAGQRLAPAVRACGGYPRDLLRIVRDALVNAPSFPVPPPTIERAIAALQQDYDLALLHANLDVLATIAGRRSLPEGEENLRACQRLFELALVLAYDNGTAWFDVHPLVRTSGRMAERLAAADLG